MSTATVDQANAASSVEPIVKTNVTYIVIQESKKDAEGNVTTTEKSVPESDEVEQDIVAGKVTEKWRQTFALPEVNTKDACTLLVPDDEEFVNIFSAGLNQKMKNRARTMPLTKDFQPVQGVIDLTDKANEKSERQRLSPAEKLARTLKDMFGDKLGATDIQSLMAQALQLANQ